MEDKLTDGTIIYLALVTFAVLLFLAEKAVEFVKWVYQAWKQDQDAEMFLRRVLRLKK